MLVSASAALTAAVLLAPSTQAAPAPPINPEDDSSEITTEAGVQDDMEKEIINDLADEWASTDDSTEKKGTDNEDEMLPPDEQQDLNAMSEDDLTTTNDDDDILMGNENDEDSVFITTAEDDTSINADEVPLENGADAGIDEPVDPLVDDNTASVEGQYNDALLDTAKENGKENVSTSLADEDSLVTDAEVPADVPEELIPQEDLEQSAFDEVTEETSDSIESLEDQEQEEPLHEDEEAVDDDPVGSELTVDAPWDEKSQEKGATDADQTEQVIDNGEETFLPDDGDDFLDNDVDLTLTNGADMDIALETENDPNLTNGVDLDTDVDTENDSNLTNGIELDAIVDEYDPSLTNDDGMDLDAATEYKEEHINDESTIMNEENLNIPPVDDATPNVADYTPQDDNREQQATTDNNKQSPQNVNEPDLTLSEESTITDNIDGTTLDDYQVDTTVQEINDTLEKALNDVQPDSALLPKQEQQHQQPEYDPFENELVNAANDPSQGGFFPSESNTATVGDDNDSSTLNILLLLAFIVLVLFKLPKLKVRL
ncbi:hypothetical protein BDB00DRAFT_816593 [Zychaea mexicana]|uniref:uncharacterized protein n=1 Tax=Zychaea mexicana TaxID=64656 RepID=UPI0022FE9786|nr:uncharacterized protein BDB00DRAFT_816593 [Zychaea mexicana]KAI9494990.1 hypothetical protein BDB00DRAFT_816593 [Zychaea mexicana]